MIVRSQEIDDAGEGGFAHQAREVMDSVIDNLAQAIRKLRDAGIEQAVLSADHGYLFAYGDRDESMRVESPGGAKVELHRRCWIGRGGATRSGASGCRPPSSATTRTSSSCFPRGVGVFKAGGDLAYHHGGTDAPGDGDPGDHRALRACRASRGQQGQADRRQPARTRSPTGSSASIVAAGRQEPRDVRVSRRS